MKYFITGKNSQLSKEYIKYLENNNIKYEAFTHKELSIENYENLKLSIEKIKPSIVINFASYNNVDNAETEKLKAYNANYLGVKNLTDLSEKYNFKLIHFSTDYIYDGNKKSLYNEKDLPNPLNYYGKTKLMGEKYSEISNNLILRVSWLYGGERSFLNTLKNIFKKDKVHISNDQVSCPTYLKDIVKTINYCIKNDINGVYNSCGKEVYNRYDWGKKYLEKLNYRGEIIPVKSDFFNPKAKRPKYSAMQNSFKEIDYTTFEEYLKNQ